MKSEVLKYMIKENQGTILSVKRNVILVRENDDTSVKGFDSLKKLGNRISKRKMKLQGDMTNSEIETNYVEYYQNLMDIAIDFSVGLKVKKNQAEPIKYNNKLYEVIQNHTTQVDWTPDVSNSLFVEIPAPSLSSDAMGYPVWYQPTGAHDAWEKDSICEWPEGSGRLWNSTIKANTTEPGTLLPWGYWAEVV